MTASVPVWIVTVIGLIGLIGIDLWIGRRPHAVSVREASTWVLVYIGLALLFAVGLWQVAGPDKAQEFVAGWLTEYSLSLDNLFVFVVIIASFAVPAELQQRVLTVGIALALLFRGIFIVIGAAALERYAWLFLFFGAFLLLTAWKVGTGDDADEDYAEPGVLRLLRRFVPVADGFRGTALVIHEGGRRMITPLLAVMVAIGSTDVLFALDSIPAIFGLTRDPYIVFTANAFALLGLRQLYFLLGGLLDRLVYLAYGLAVILGFIGLKLVAEGLLAVADGRDAGWAHWIEANVPEVGIGTSLAVIVGSLLVTTVASVAASRRRLAGAGSGVELVDPEQPPAGPAGPDAGEERAGPSDGA
jgi:tellurite resistance protein TerC